MLKQETSPEQKISTKLLKDLVAALDKTLDAADVIKKSFEAGSPVISDATIEFSKASGLASGICQEAALLIQDIQTTIVLMQNPNAQSKTSAPASLGGLFKSIKGGNFN